MKGGFEISRLLPPVDHDVDCPARASAGHPQEQHAQEPKAVHLEGRAAARDPAKQREAEEKVAALQDRLSKAEEDARGSAARASSAEAKAEETSGRLRSASPRRAGKPITGSASYPRNITGKPRRHARGASRVPPELPCCSPRITRRSGTAANQEQPNGHWPAFSPIRNTIPDSWADAFPEEMLEEGNSPGSWLLQQSLGSPLLRQSQSPSAALASTLGAAISGPASSRSLRQRRPATCRTPLASRITSLTIQEANH